MLKFQDRATVGVTKETADGYLTAVARAVRTGVQDYLASEIGLSGSHVVKVYRPPSEVFSDASLASFSHAPVTMDHPKEMVDADNWAALAKGEVSTAALKDGEWISLPLILKDAAAIKSVKSGKVQLSAGYTASIDIEDGVTPEGEKYGAIMRDIKINHLAIVDNARAGSKARIGDADNWGASPVTTKGPAMELTKVVIGDKAISVAASDADVFTKLIADKDTEIGTLTAKLSDATAKNLTDVQLADKVKAMAEFTAKKEAVRAKFGDEAIKDASDAMIEGMHRVIGDAKDDTMREAVKTAKPVKDDEWANIYKKGAK